MRPSRAALLPLAVTAVAVALGGTPRPGAAVEPAAPVEQVWKSDCAVCHGPAGRGSPLGTSLKGVGRASVHYQLTTGRMPLVAPGRSEAPGRPRTPLPASQPVDVDRIAKRHAPSYDQATIDALVDYVGRLVADGGPPVPVVGPGDVAAGGRLYRESCAACHSWSGEGGALYGREAPPLGEATPVQIAEAVRVGPAAMPAFGPAAFTDRQVDDLVAYVRAIDDPQDRGGLGLAHIGPVAEGAVALAVLALLLAVCVWIGDRRHAV